MVGIIRATGRAYCHLGVGSAAGKKSLIPQLGDRVWGMRFPRANELYDWRAFFENA